MVNWAKESSNGFYLSVNPASLFGDSLADDILGLVLVGADDDVAGVVGQHDLHQLPANPRLGDREREVKCYLGENMK